MKNILILLSVITLFSSCGKDGATGPQGPQGPQGNANVGSTTFNVDPSAWTYYISSLNYYEVTVNDPQISSDIVNNGAVSAFYSSDNINWIALPWNDLQSTTFSISYEYQYSVNSVSFLIIPSDNGAITIPTLYYKAIAIAGSVKKKNPNTNWNNYQEVMKVMNSENK
jgi:hypothetical protein